MTCPRTLLRRRPSKWLLAATLGLTLAFVGTATAQECGDVNGDGSITAADALSALGVATGILPSCDLCSCDPDCDRESTATDALQILRSAVGLDEIACCVLDACFADEDCPTGQICTGNPAASCDFICLGSTTTTSSTTLPLAIDECFEDADCVQSGFPEGYVCAGYECVECDEDLHCDDEFVCAANECLPDTFLQY